MILLADSGSTKTTWVLLDKKNQIATCNTQGFSPSFQSSDTMTNIMLSELNNDFLQQKNNQDLQIFYYGTGCSTKEKVELMKNGLQGVFTKATITVNHDLYAAAIALCGNEPGIACILGTGCNSCYFDGKEIKENVLSLGYFFGDQGSGSYIGKTLLQYYLENNLPADLQKEFSSLPQFAIEYIFDNVYKKPMPQRFLASYTKIVGKHIQHPFMQELVKKCFRDFFVHQVEKYSTHKNYPVHFIGSVAFYFQEQLHEVMTERGLQKGIILQSPMEGLIKYHTGL